MNTFKHLLVISLCLLLLGSVTAQESTPDIATVKSDFIENIQKKMKKQNIVGASIIVVSKNEILWKEHLGFADKEKGLALSDNTLFALGSVTKVFTAATVMQLSDKGMIDIDASLSQYLSEFKIHGDNAGGVTPRNILSHHSGLPSDILKGMFTTQPEDYKETVNYINQEYMAGIPNQIRAYSNPGYTLLGHMIKEVSGVEYPEYLQSNVLDPLQMNQSGFDNDANRSKAFDSKGNEVVEGSLRDIPAGGLWSSTTDMSKFMMAYLNQSESLMSSDAFSQVLAQQHLTSELDMGNQFGLGWTISERPHAGVVYNHTGTTQYFNAALALAPETGLGVVILTNSDKGGYLFKPAMNLLDDFAKAMGNAKAEEKPKVELGNKKRIKVDRAELAKDTGVYLTPGAYMRMYTRGKKLFVKLQGIRAELVPVGDHIYILKPILLHLIPIKLNDERVIFEEIGGYQVMTSLEMGGEKDFIASKFEVTPISGSWKNALGDYNIVDALEGEIPFFENFSLKESDGLLILSFAQASNGQKIQMVLETINDNRAKVAGLGRYAGQSVTIQNSKLKAFGLTLQKTEK